MRSGGRGIDPFVDRLAEAGRQVRIELRRIFSGDRQHFRREQIHDDAVFVGDPCGAVTTEKCRPRTFFTAES